MRKFLIWLCVFALGIYGLTKWVGTFVTHPVASNEEQL